MSLLDRLLRRRLPQSTDEWARAAEVRRAHAPALLEIDGVVSVGLGRTEEGAPAIVVGLAADDEPRDLPDDVDGVAVRVKRTGSLVAREGGPSD
ncbi:MAG: hypothetical protein QMC79_08290 [Anaerosomatales bacterium]|nr:hypothetical protein [Anaerosomatales bacterium]